ncbi:tautomerase family protein [Priestia endophytica]|jgi:phenylpyruvate tautomerase PptA (4-oxalocrotonate tautomerase family)|uniref:Phenylpyruvate tautomerase PptA, 4-oxalocrotonate tautomerase family n=1 Tax=Priestia endophytica DSM 13796 TaxID=1121089 RepID=A0A1I5ZID4_9BACI|nr:tautomerase family protein [Priestia endophytica]KYG29789.1 4-oxalocrotonate tautomerase [Priestia endophytica]MBG9812556.1 4-oxalocrotonate tautomerase [Priestia endophytica]SFQ56216.1 Phenylpyruvate tautomerase PptA, 4-oxalocrotonate tautomerase family [Priestia endophytica DSM 13796]
MPFVHVYYPKSQGEEKELKKVSEEIHKSLITYFNIPAEDYFQFFSPYDLGQFYYHSNYLLEHKAKRTDKMILISITCAPGRIVQQKIGLYQAIADAFNEHFNIPIENIFITLNETHRENWSFGQGKAQMISIKEER